MFKSFLLVCVGNICRSPMAEALLAKECRNAGADAVVESAGIGALIGAPADPYAQELMAGQGIDITQHRARQLTPSMLMQYDLILTMELEQVKAVEAMHPSARGRVYRLGHWSGFDIPDPYRQRKEAFVNALELIQQGISDWKSKTGIC